MYSCPLYIAKKFLLIFLLIFFLKITELRKIILIALAFDVP